MPLVADSFDRLSNTNIFGKLDFDQATGRCGLLQAMNRKLRVMRYGSFELFVMSFDLTNGSTTFYNLMNDVFRDYIDHFVFFILMTLWWIAIHRMNTWTTLGKWWPS